MGPDQGPGIMRGFYWIYGFKTPHFARKFHSLDPTFGNPDGTHTPKYTHTQNPTTTANKKLN